MKVKAIRYVGKADVYNMEVEDTHDFVVQGGVVVQNCLDSIRYICMARPKAPRVIKDEKKPMYDPLNQFTETRSRYKTIFRR